MCLDRWPEFFHLKIVDGMTPLHLVCSMPMPHHHPNQEATIQFIVQHRPTTIILQDRWGKTPAHYVLSTGHGCNRRRIIEYLLEHSTTPGFLLVEDHEGMTPLFAAAAADADADTIHALFYRTAFHPGSNLLY
jgi:ankyrin repeat protein